MVISSHTERVLGDIFLARRSSPSTPVPRMLRDLLASEEICSALPSQALYLIQTLIGSARAFNLRNILWHGFLSLMDPATQATLAKFTAATILLHLSILRECTDKIWPTSPPSSLSNAAATVALGTGQKSKEDAAAAAVAAPLPGVKAAPRRPLKHRCPGDAALKAHLSSALFTPAADAASSSSSSSNAATPAASSSTSSVAAFTAAAPDAAAWPPTFDSWPIPPSLVWGPSPSAFASLTSDLRFVLASSYFLPHHLVHDVLHAWDLLSQRNHYLALCVLMPVVESVGRHWFVYANAEGYHGGSGGSGGEGLGNDRIEAGLLQAQSERLFTTMRGAVERVVLRRRSREKRACGGHQREGECRASIAFHLWRRRRRGACLFCGVCVHR